MKKFKLLTLIAGLFLLTLNVTGAIPAPNISGQKEISDNTVTAINENPATLSSGIDTDKQFQMLTDRYMGHIKNCTPFHFNNYLDLFGLKISLQADINGWNANNKCEYYISANIGGIGDDIREIFGLNFKDEEIAKIKPVINCAFTQDQLNIIVDALKSHSEQQKQYIKEVMNKPNKDITPQKQKMTPQEERATQMLLTSGACQIPNTEELMQQFSNLMTPQSENEDL